METEAKYNVPNEETFALLKAVERFGQYVRRDTQVKTVHDRYVDTPGRNFYHHQLFARLREAKRKDNGSSAPTLLLTLKRLGTVEDAVHTRDEYEVEVSTMDPSSWPEGEVRSMTEEVAMGQPLNDLVTVDQVRTVSILYKGRRAIAEFSLDDVMIQTPDKPVRAFELEIELLPEGTLADLRALDRIMAGQYGLSAQPLSKFERAMRAISPAGDGHEPSPEAAPTEEPQAAPDDAQPTISKKGDKAPQPEKLKQQMGVLAIDSMDTAGRKILRVYFGMMLANEEGTRLGEDPEALHDMRVATRRMRAALRVTGPYMDEQSVRTLTRGLRSVTRSLGGVRDLDVLIDNARGFRDGLPVEEQVDMDGLLDEWVDTRERARRELLKMLRSEDYERFKKRMKTFLDVEDPEPGSGFSQQGLELESEEVRHKAGSAIWMRYEDVRAFETVMASHTIEQLHALRIKGKYLRYTLECFREVLPSEAGGLIRDVVKMQDQIGALHDADVASGLVRDYVIKSHKASLKRGEMEPKTPPGLAAYYNYLKSEMERIVGDFSGTWDSIGGGKWRLRLAEAIAGI